VKRSRQKPRFLPAGYKVMSAESAAGDFQPMDEVGASRVF
jgi:hypothetical protein